MSRNLPLAILRQKIQELETALFFVLSNELLKMPVHIIRAVCVDDLGQIWFLLPMPSQSVKEFSPVFLSKLDFFRKQKDFSLSVTGRTFFVTDPEELNNADGIPAMMVQRAVQGEAVLVKMKIEKLGYQEKKPIHRDLVFNWKTDFLHRLASVFSFIPRIDLPNLRHEWRSQHTRREMKSLDPFFVKEPAVFHET